MRPSKIIDVLGVGKVQVYLGRQECYFSDPVEAEHHSQGHSWWDALVIITGDPRAAYRVSMAGKYAHLPLESKEFRAYLEAPADPF